MDPSTFRRDPWLRTSGYHLITWSLIALALELRRTMEGGASFVVVLVGGAVLTSLTHERRVGKMAGVAGEPVYPATALVWNATALLLAFGSLVLLASRPEFLFPYWMLVGGSGLLIWGRRARFAWFAGLGASMIMVSLVDCVAYPQAEWLRVGVLGLVLPAAGLATNSRYLWFRAAR